MNPQSFTETYTRLFYEIRPHEKVNMKSVYELMAEKLFSDEYDAILALYPAFDKKVL